MRFSMLIFYLILILFGISFAVLNAGSVEVNLYFTAIKLPIPVFIILIFSVGVVIGLLFFVSRYWHLKREYKKIKTQLDLKEAEVRNIRAIPLKNQH